MPFTYLFKPFALTLVPTKYDMTINVFAKMTHCIDDDRVTFDADDLLAFWWLKPGIKTRDPIQASANHI